MHLRMAGMASVVVAALVGCQTITRMGNPSFEASDVKYLDSDWSPKQCMLSRARSPKIKVCIQGNGNVQNAQAKTRQAVLAWLAPLQAKYKGIATDVDFTCQGQHGTVNVYSGTVGSMGAPGWIQVGDSDPLATWMHEFGHAFACLGDTYLNGMTEHCSGPQPKSIMCYGHGVANLTADDTASLIHQFQHFQDTPVDPKGDVDADSVNNGVDRCPGTLAGQPVWKDQLDGKWRGCGAGQTPSLL